MRKKFFISILLFIALFFSVGCASGSVKDDKIKVALLLSGPANDQGWNAIALEGLEAAKEMYGIETSYVENVQLADMESAYTDYATKGYDLIIGHGYQFGEAAINVAKNFPNQRFMATEANSKADNMASYVMSCEQGGYLMGILAASMSETGKIGIVGGFEQPAIVKEVEAYKLGAKSVNPNIVIYTMYINSWTDVTMGKEAALSIADKGADVINHLANQAGTGVIKAAEERGLIAIGSSYDQSSIAPNTVICSTEYSMPKVILSAVNDVINGEFKGGIIHLGMVDGVVGITGYGKFESKVPQAVKEKIQTAIDNITSGKLNIPVIEESTK